MKTICYRGFLGGPRSMGKVGYHLVSYLLTRNHYRVCFYPWKNDYMAEHWGDEIARLVIQEPSGLDIDQCISFCSILDARQHHFAQRTTPWLFYELNSLPQEFVESLDTNDHIYVTSSFVQRVFLDQGVATPVSVLGHGFDPEHYRFFPRSTEGEFTFLCLAENTPRKNLPTLIRCFERAFQGSHDVRLALKLGLHGIGQLRGHISCVDKVTFLTEALNDEADLVKLYQKAHCFVLPTRSEGFGMPILEAMATGLPVIVTNYGGHLDFCNDENSYLIQTRGLVDSDPACFPYIQSQWSEPDEDHLIDLMRYVYRNYDRASEVGIKGWKTVSADWTWEKQLARAFP